MSIQATKYITREWAIQRILEVDVAAAHSRFRDLNAITSEEDNSLKLFVMQYQGKEKYTEAVLEQFTDSMLEEILDQPFFRESLFDNYLISEDHQ